MIEHVIIVHFHELSLKGKNRSWFEKTLLKNIKRHLIGLPYSNINRLSGRIIIGDIDLEEGIIYKGRLVMKPYLVQFLRN